MVSKKKVWVNSNYIYILAVFCFCFSYALSLVERYGMSRFFLLGTFAIMACAFVLSVCKRYDYLYVKQIFWCYFVMAVFWNVAYLSSYTNKSHTLVVMGGLVFLNFATTYWAIEYCKFISKSAIIEKIKNYWPVLSICLIVLLCSLEVIFSYPRVDSMGYYGNMIEAKNWDFTFETIRKFQFAAHKCFGYSLFAMIGEFLWPNNASGIYAMNIVLLLITILAFYEVLNAFFPEKKKANVLMTAFFAINPLIMGLVFEISLDLPLMCFLVWFLYSYYYKHKIWQVVTALLLVFSKEPGILILFGFAVGWSLGLIINCDFDIKKIINRIFEKNRDIISFILPAILFVGLFFLGDHWMQNMDSLSTEGGSLFSWSINSSNIITKLKEMYLMNFAWIVAGIIILGGVILVVNRSHGRIQSGEKNRNDMLEMYAPLIGYYLLFVIFQLVYVTYCNPRYVMPHIPGMLVVFSAILYALPWKKLNMYIIQIVLIALLFIENFYTLDPITLKMFKNVNIGSTNIVTTRTFGSPDGKTLTTDPIVRSEREMTHAAAYNRQYMYLKKVIEKSLKGIDYNSDTLVVVDPIYGEFMTYLTYFGKWSGENDVYYYNTEEKRIVVSNESDAIVLNLLLTTDPQEVETQSVNYERVYYLTASYRAEYENGTLLNYYESAEQHDVEYRGWIMNVSKLK